MIGSIKFTDTMENRLKKQRTRCLILNSYTPNASIGTMGSDMNHALNALGIATTEHLGGNYAHPKLFEAMMLMIGQSNNDSFVLEMNAKTNNIKTFNPMVGEKSLFDDWKLPRVTFLTDNPCGHMERIQASPDYSILGVVDLDFIDWLADYQIPARRVFGMPHAGPQPCPVQLSTREREIDVLFVGNISAQQPMNEWLSTLSGKDDGLVAVFDRILERCRSNDEGIYQVVVSELSKAGHEVSKEDIVVLVQEFEKRIISMRRHELIENAKNSKMVICGSIDRSAFPHCPENLDLKDQITFEDFQDLAMNSKIILNSTPSFRNGAHERIFYGMSYGAHILTEPSRFLRHEVENDLGISFLDFDAATLDRRVEEILSRGDELDRVRERALLHYAANHTWVQRMKTVLEILEEEFWSV